MTSLSEVCRCGWCDTPVVKVLAKTFDGKHFCRQGCLNLYVIRGKYDKRA